jgi:drug/metabolite transporter (DMT)-like permease
LGQIAHTNRDSPNLRLTRGYLICLSAVALWSTTAIIIGYLIQTFQMPPLLLAFWRDGIVFLFLIMVFSIFNRSRLNPGSQQRRFFILYGFILSAFNAIWTVSVALNGAAVSTVLAYSAPAFTVLLAHWIFKEELTRAKALAVILSLGGCFLISGAYNPQLWGLNPIGIITGLLSGLLFAAYNLMGKASSERAIYPWTAMLFSFGIAALFLFLYIQLPLPWPQGISSSNLLWLDGEWVGWLALIVLAVGPTAGGFGLYIVSLSYLPVGIASLIATIEPVITAGLAYMLLGERFTIPQLIGGVLIVMGVVLLRVNEGRRRELKGGKPDYG